MFDFLKRLFGPGTDFKALKEKGAIIVDVRTPGEFMAGNISGSLNIPLDSLKAQLPILKKKNLPVIAVCRSGNRSAMAVAQMKQVGLEAYNGGSWISLKSKIG